MLKRWLCSFLPIMVAATFLLTSCGPKDADIKTSVESSIKADPDLAGVSVDVKDKVVTLGGEVKDAAFKSKAESTAKSAKGVKDVVNNVSVAAPPPPPAQVEITVDDALIKSVTDATKDFPTVKATVNDGVITLTGEIKKASLPKLMMTLNSLKPKKIENQLTIK